ncbi:beta-ketoacyl synthase N-terminal-like domain-containing protein [Proteus mirabilis]|uniref:beta-ketoacyl synthase N-terminal-like domain-containing protein n=1 Tax=Proteus mirabilis TaxID=584 RepID=UPI0029E91991|nr:3-ketoacyl-ACP synthase [Proteus mirabilis]
MKNVAISGWELNLPSIVNFEQLSEQLLLKRTIKTEKYFSDDYFVEYFKFNHNPAVIPYQNIPNNHFEILTRLIHNSLKRANITLEKLRASRTIMYLAGHGPRADFMDYQGFYDKNDAEDVQYSPQIKSLHAASFAQDELANKLWAEYQLDFPPIPIYCASNSALMAVHIGHNEISQDMADIVIVLSWNSLLLQDIAFMDSQGMLVEAHAQPLSKYSDGVTLSDGYAVMILESQQQINSRQYLVPAYIYHSVFMQSNAERTMGGTLFNFYTISKVISQLLDLSHYLPSDIGAIFIHGNGSIISDKAETVAITNIFKQPIPIISYKGQIGYISNCSGIIDLMIIADSLKNNRLIPSTTHYPIDDGMEVNFLTNQECVNYSAKPILKIGLGMDGSIIAMLLIANGEQG